MFASHELSLVFKRKDYIMSIKAIVGANWGDEGKGKMVDVLSEEAGMVIRYQGGANAGHTVINDYGKFALHLLPSGVFRKNTINLLGPGVALDPQLFCEEHDYVKTAKIEPIIRISDRTQILMPFHKYLDECEEERLKKNAFGSTKKGIAPFYADKALKVGLMAGDIDNDSYRRERIAKMLIRTNALLVELYGKKPLTVDEVDQEIKPYVAKIAELCINSTKLIKDSIDKNDDILLEGQLGSLRDPDHGIFPFTTSSSTLAGYATIGAGIPPCAIDEIIAVTKAYSSCVGAGPFTSEVFGDLASSMREKGGDKGEYGATTGRPRRMGWYDAVATRYGCQVQGATSLALTNIDCLSGMEEIMVCDSYAIDGEKADDFPMGKKLDRARPVLKAMKGWKKNIRGITNMNELPKETLEYIDYIEKSAGVKIKYLSTGPKRKDIIFL